MASKEPEGSSSRSPDEEGVPLAFDPMKLLLGLLMGPGDDWYTAERVSRAKLQEKYPTATRFRKTSGNIAAIDFGTTFCSLAYATEVNPDEDLTNVDVNTVPLDNSRSRRVPTAILLRKAPTSIPTDREDGDKHVLKTCCYEVVSFGREAVKQCNTLSATKRSEYLYFERFKMTLQHDENVNRNMTTKSSNGRDFYLVEVIAFVLKHVKNQLESHLKQAESPLKGSDFDWVITVPAIWRARGKRMMREAAYMAGLTSVDPGISCFLVVGKGVPRPLEINPDHITLALEPEAAAIYCQTMKTEHLANHCKVSGSLQSNQYVVVDIGGGTVDITVHRQDIEGPGIKVVIPPVGNDCGGTMVNKEFAKFMESVVDDKGFERFLESSDTADHAKKESAVSQLLYHEFENEKVAFGERISASDEDCAIKLPVAFSNFYKLAKINIGADSHGIYMEDDNLYIPAEKMEAFFHPAISGILECVTSVLEKLQDDVDTVYLVGGFGGCKYSYDKIHSDILAKFPKKNLRIIVPKDHSLAVAQGAVKYRLKPDAIYSRTMDASYGTAFVPEFNPLIHDVRYAGLDRTGTPRVKDVYMKYVEKGEQIPSSEVVTEIFHPLNNTATSADLSLYSSSEKGTKYVNDPEGKPLPSVRKIGEIHLDMPNPNNLTRDERGIELTMDFSHTEIQIRARYLVTGEEVKVVADFLSSQVEQQNLNE